MSQQVGRCALAARLARRARRPCGRAALRRRRGDGAHVADRQGSSRRNHDNRRPHAEVCSRKGTRSQSAAGSDWPTIRASGSSPSRSSGGSGPTAAGTATRRPAATAPRSTAAAAMGRTSTGPRPGQRVTLRVELPVLLPRAPPFRGPRDGRHWIHESFVTPHYPSPALRRPAALVVLARMGFAGDPRAADVARPARGAAPCGRSLARRRALVEALGVKGSNVEVFDWGRGPSEQITLNAVRVLRAAA